jgi:hypothetical protein
VFFSPNTLWLPREGLLIRGGAQLRQCSTRSTQRSIPAKAGGPGPLRKLDRSKTTWRLPDWLFCASLAKTYGGYLGEVVIGNMGGAWELQDNPDGSARVVLHCEGLTILPADRVKNRRTEDLFASVSGYCRALRAIMKLAKLEIPPADDASADALTIRNGLTGLASQKRAHRL